MRSGRGECYLWASNRLPERSDDPAVDKVDVTAGGLRAAEMGTLNEHAKRKR
jgi:hypothetical protein